MEKKILTTPIDVPFNFTISIKESRTAKDIVHLLDVEQCIPNPPTVKTLKNIRIVSNEHKSYTRFFEELAQVFGTRVPLNSQVNKDMPSFTGEYREVLTENLTDNILYGYGDPAVLRVDERNGLKGTWYYLLATSNDAPDSFPIIRSRNLKDWEFVGFVFPKGSKPSWAADGLLISDYWAPEMHLIGDEFKIYFVARDRNTSELCIGIAKSTQPDGPFISEKEPILKENVIDPHVFVEDDNTVYLYWKKDNNDLFPALLTDLLFKYPDFIVELFPKKEDQITASFIQTLWSWARNLQPMDRFLFLQILIEAITPNFLSFQYRLKRLRNKQTYPFIKDDINAVLQVIRTPVYAQKLSDDGTRLVGKPRKVLENDKAWEAHLVEGMWVTKHRGKYYLFYAGNDFSTDRYGIGVAIANSPLGPFKKMPKPFLRSTSDWSGPGHPSVVIGPDGEYHMFLHAYFPRKTGYKEFRALLAVPIAFKPDCVLLR
ncbi:MAG: glycoside hydrolase family 43 protein [Acidobacteriota bacterium]|nr:glycoside hydrolase family 43 protein [Acidobacteriota bacterium]